jgi:hypothetical protein
MPAVLRWGCPQPIPRPAAADAAATAAAALLLQPCQLQLPELVLVLHQLQL